MAVRRVRTLVVVWVLVLVAASCGGGDVGEDVSVAERPAPAASEGYDEFAAELDSLRELLRIPGMSAAVVRNQEVVWAQGFGFADLANGVPAAADTPYHLASVTKPIATTMIMQLVEEGLIALDDPVADYRVDLGRDREVEVWHLLSHTSSGAPGTVHSYDGNRFAQLDAVVEAATGSSFDEQMRLRIIEPAGMTRTAGNTSGCSAGETDEHVEAVRRAMAMPYQLDRSHEVVASSYPDGYSPAAGLIASVTDIAGFDIALDRGELVSARSVEDMFEPLFRTSSTTEGLAYGLGWYSQDHDGTRLVWHSGRWPPSVSALYLKVPEHDLTFVVAANTPNLTTPFPLGGGDVLSSALALAFYREFLFPELHGTSAPRVDWTAEGPALEVQISGVDDPAARWLVERELWARRQAMFSVGRADEADALGELYDAVHVETRDLHQHLQSAADTPVFEEGVELTADEMELYVGRYVLDRATTTWPPDAGEPPEPVVITIESSRLMACAGDESPDELVPMGDHRFRVAGGPTGTFVITAVVEGGAVVGLRADVTPGVSLVYVPA